MRLLASRIARAAAAVFALCLVTASCNGTTGDQLITFSAYAAGAPGAAAPFTTFDETGSPAFRVQLTRASMYIGALYFDESPPSTGTDTPACITPDIYAAQVPGGLEVDLLSSAPQAFPVAGNGSADTALSWDLWLANGDINASANLGVHIVDLQGFATRLSDGKVTSFAAIVTISAVLEGAGARLEKATTAGLPGQYPICKERILDEALPDGLPFFQGGNLHVTVDPRQWFITSNLDFAGGLEAIGEVDCTADQNANATYENGQSCSDSAPCSNGFVCNYDHICIAEYCIPDTNYPTDTTISAASEFFAAIQGGGPAAYGVTFTR